MPPLLEGVIMSIGYILVRNLIITLVVISVPLLVMFFSKKNVKNRAIENADKIIEESGEILQMLSRQYVEATGEDIMQFLRKSIVKAMFVIEVILLSALIKGMSMLNYWGIYAILTGYVLFFFFMDVLRVFPFKKCYNVIGIKCGSFMGMEDAIYVCFYDFIQNKYVVADVLDNKKTKNLKFVRLLVVAKHNKLQVVSLLEKNK